MKKIFLDSSPHRQPAQKGEGVRVENVGGIYSTGKCAVLAICVRTQIDFNHKGGITAHSDNKTRLNRFIFIYNGHYSQKRHTNGTGTSLKCIFMHNITTNLYIYALKSANSATPTLIPPLTPYLSPRYDMHKYT